MITDKSPSYSLIRIIPRETSFLDRRVGSRGEIFYDITTNTLRLFDGGIAGGYELVKTDLSNIDNDTFKLKAEDSGIVAAPTISEDPPTAPRTGELWFDTDTGILYLYYNDGTSTQWVQPANISVGGGSGGGSSSDSFTTIAVAGQSNVVADSSTDTLTLVAGSNITITTDADTDTITISSAGVGGGESNQNAFSNVAVSGQSTVSADTTTDTLTLVAGTNISITTDAGTDTITINSTAPGNNFNDLSDTARASIRIDQIAYQAIARLIVDNVSSTAYTFNSHYAGNNPTIYVINGTTISFDLTGAEGHPFLIQDPTGTNYNTGLIHVATDGTTSTGAAAQGKDSGTLYWQVPKSITGNYRYQCTLHTAMVGSIVIKDIAII